MQECCNLWKLLWWCRFVHQNRQRCNPSTAGLQETRFLATVTHAHVRRCYLSSTKFISKTRRVVILARQVVGQEVQVTVLFLDRWCWTFRIFIRALTWIGFLIYETCESREGREEFHQHIFITHDDNWSKACNDRFERLHQPISFFGCLLYTSDAADD